MTELWESEGFGGEFGEENDWGAESVGADLEEDVLGEDELDEDEWAGGEEEDEAAL
ncbi:MAG TPA: hypothetical protein VNJ53_02035 [Gaiellaceae bacterium]|nr:hypothetical protein [Gaiellaceae bacterium]